MNFKSNGAKVACFLKYCKLIICEGAIQIVSYLILRSFR